MNEIKKQLCKMTRFLRLKAEWKKKTPKEKWQFIFNIGSFCAETIQINLFTTQKVGFFGNYLVFMVLLNFALAIFTVYFYISIGEFQKCFSSFCVTGIFVNVMSNKVEMSNGHCP